MFRKQRDRRRLVQASYPTPKPEPVQHGDYPIRVPKRAVRGRKGRYANSICSARDVNLFATGKGTLKATRFSNFYDDMLTRDIVKPKRYSRWGNR